MKLKTTLFTITLCIILSSSLWGQKLFEHGEFDHLTTTVQKPLNYSTRIDASNEIRLLITGAFSFYKNFLSSQDMAHCTFYPSCSVYALQTLQTNGLLGFFDAIDRLTRCNGLSPEKYTIHQSSHLFYDPVHALH